MPIRIISYTPKKVSAEYVQKNKVYPEVTVLGKFDTEVEAKLAAAMKMLREGHIGVGQYLGIISSIKSPRSKKYYSEIGKSGMGKRWNKK